MNQYHKIQTIYKRDPETNHKTLLEGEYSEPEFEYLKDNKWIFTEKVDGTNIRVMYGEDKIVRFGGKDDSSQISTFLYNKLQDLFTVEILNKVCPDGNICLYGEGCGSGIQKRGGRYISDGVDFILFDVRISDWWLKREDVEDIANKLSIKTVPIIGSGTLQNATEMTKEGFKSQWGDFIAEGLVLRPEIELFSRSGKRIITKIKYKDFVKENKP